MHKSKLQTPAQNKTHKCKKNRKPEVTATEQRIISDDIQGVPIKNNPLGKFIIPVFVIDFFSLNLQP